MSIQTEDSISLCKKALQIVSDLCLGGQVESEKCLGIFPVERSKPGKGSSGKLDSSLGYCFISFSCFSCNFTLCYLTAVHTELKYVGCESTKPSAAVCVGVGKINFFVCVARLAFLRLSDQGKDRCFWLITCFAPLVLTKQHISNRVKKKNAMTRDMFSVCFYKNLTFWYARFSLEHINQSAFYYCPI